MDLDEAAIATLEQALADLGALVVRAEKYRPLTALVLDADRRARTLGADARRLLRHEALAPAAVRAMLDEATRQQQELRTAIDDATAGADYRAAVDAYRDGDHARLAPLIGRIFAAVEPAPEVPFLYLPVPWTRRGRALGATVISATVELLAQDGLAADGDDLSAGADATVQAIMLEDQPPEDEPVVLRIDAARSPAPVFRHVETGTYLIYQPRLRLPFVVELADALDLDAAPADYPAYRAALATALRAAGLAVADAERDEPSR